MPLHKNTTAKLSRRSNLSPAERLSSALRWSHNDYQAGQFRTMLYRFLAEQVPVMSSCLWTWVRLSAAPGRWVIDTVTDDSLRDRALGRLATLSDSIYGDLSDRHRPLADLMPELFAALYRDGIFGGFIALSSDSLRVDRFIPIDAVRFQKEVAQGQPRLYLETNSGKLDLERPDFYYLAFNDSIAEPFGRSIFQSVPFVAYIEQQLVDDMRRASHNSGYHRLHVKVTPPDRLSGESETAYHARINDYFDSTVRMIRECDIDDNPVTWNNVQIDYIGAERATTTVTNSWFITHRAVIEDMCAGTNLAPYLLGYSYGATSSWASFKFDVVMRQVRSVQSQVSRFLEWLAGIDLALAGIDVKPRWEFDNSFAYQAAEAGALKSTEIENLIKLHAAGLVDAETAKQKAANLL